MLKRVCDYIHNYFAISSHPGTYQISNGQIELESIAEGQRFRIRGSALNDGIYTYHSDRYTNDDDDDVALLSDETFTGNVEYLAIDPDLMVAVRQIKAWEEKNRAVLDSPCTSESFEGHYSYSKAAGKNGGLITWHDAFSASLNPWRKIG